MRRKLPPTREGWWFLLATVVVGAVAVDAGLNLFFLSFGMMACLLVASGALSTIALAGLRIQRIPPPVIHAGTPYLMGISLTNRKRRLPSFSVEVEDLVDGRPIEKRCYFLKLPAGRSQETSYRHVISRRGRHRLSGFRLATKFPFGLMVRAKQVTAPLELVVYPALAALPPAVLRALPAPRSQASREKGASRHGDLAGLRLFRPGDDPRDIHWRTSARRGVLFVREHEDDLGHEALVELDNHAGAGAQEFELAVSRAATLCVELARRGLAVGLLTRAAEIPPGAGPDHLARLLRLLAFVAPDAGPRARSRCRPLVRVRGDAQIELPGVPAPRQAEHA
ncbi:MAG TPA: DUF58 domain-containing protein [Polyangia bacterium]|nr:DUF58 domain-containing protein [Polyangia bacterium]